MKLITTSRTTGVSDYLVTLGAGREVLLDTGQFLHLATAQAEVDEIAETARAALFADEPTRLAALKAILRLAAGTKADFPERKAP